jgi:hypothetical protein
MFATMNDMSWDGSVDSVSTRKPSRFENDEFIKAKAEPWVCYIGMYPDPLTSAAVAAQTVAQGGMSAAQIASDAAIAVGQEKAAGLRSIFETAEQALQTAQMIAALYQTIKEWDTAEKTRRQWEARNSAEFGAKASEYNRQRSNAATQRDLALKNIGLDRTGIGLGKDKVYLDKDRVDIHEDQLDLKDKEFDVAGAAAGTERAGVGALEQAEEEAAGIAGTGVQGVKDYLNSLTARAGDYEDEAKAFTDPLIAAAPGTTVGGSRYGGDFAAASGPEAYARDSRKAEIAAFAEAMSESTDPLANIDIGRSGLGAQQDKINREMGLAGSDQNLAGAGLRNKGVALSKNELGLDRKGLNIDLAALGLDSSRTNINTGLKNSQYADIAGRLASQGQLDRIAQAYPLTLHGQQSVMFPAAQMLGTGADLVGQFKPSKTKISPNAYGTYGSGARNSYGVGTYNPKSGAGGF